MQDKARRAFDIIKTPVLLEDVPLTFLVLKSLPDPLIKWFLESLGNEGISRLLDGFDDRSALAEVEFAICDETGVHTFGDSMGGSIAKNPRGEGGFGWDPVFIPRGCDTEMMDNEKHATSMRGIALEKLAVLFGKIPKVK